MTENQITEIVIGRAIKVHRTLGPGLLESAYETCLCYELDNTQLLIERQKPIPLVYEDIRMGCGYRVDIMVNKKVIIEVKSVDALNDIHLAQMLTYLKLAECKVGLLMNFNVLRLTDGIKRAVSNF